MPYRFPEGLVPGFSVTVEGDPQHLKLVCGGTLDAREATTVVQTELLRLHESVVTDKVTDVAVDVRNVDYMNSSGIKAFLTWFLKAEGERRHRYKIDLTFDRGRSWQSVSCTAMGKIAHTVLRLQPMESTDQQ